MTIFELLIFSLGLLFISMVAILILLLLKQRSKIKQNKIIDALSRDYEKALLNSKIEIQENTANYVAREIHDNIGSLTTLIILNLSAIDFENIEHAKIKISQTKEIAKEANEKLRNLSVALNSETTLSDGFGNSLTQYLSKIQKTEIFKIDIEFNKHDIRFNIGKEIMLYRICQEIINNIIKHSKAQHIKVLISYSQNNLNVKIEDDGIGFDIIQIKNSEKGIGLKNIMARAKIINASVEITSEIGKGTIINLILPI